MKLRSLFRPLLLVGAVLLLVAAPLVAQTPTCSQSKTTRLVQKGSTWAGGTLKSWYVSTDSVAQTCKGFPAAVTVHDTIRLPGTVDTLYLPAPRDSTVVVVPPPAPTEGTNEPAGFTALLDRPFTVADEGNNIAYGGASAFTMVKDASAPTSPSGVLRMLHQPGNREAGGPKLEGPAFPATMRQVYTRFVWRVSPNHVFHSFATKLWYPYTGNDGGWVIEFEADGSVSSGTFSYAAFPQSSCGAQTQKDNVSKPGLVRGIWYQTEILLDYRDLKNGRARWWTRKWDGTQWGPAVLNADWSNVCFDRLMTLNRFTAYRGGAADAVGIPALQWIDLDHWYLSWSK